MRHLTVASVIFFKKNLSKIYGIYRQEIIFFVDNDDVNVSFEMPLMKVSIMTEILSSKRSNLYGKLISDECR